jgi:hypothetical protein
VTQCRCELHMLARQIKRETVPFYLRWLPGRYFSHVNAAVSQVQSEDVCLVIVPADPRHR